MVKIFWAVLVIGTFGFASIALADKSNKRDVDATNIVSGASCATTANTDTTVDTFDEVACQLVWSVASHNDATMAVHASVDGTNFELISGSSYTLAAAAGNHIWQISVGAYADLRFVYAKGSNTTGTYLVTCRKEVPAGSEN